MKKISSAQSVVSSGEVKASAALQWCRGGGRRRSSCQSAALGKLRDQVTLAGGKKFASLAISAKGL